jgi:hypothetical protein
LRNNRALAYERGEKDLGHVGKNYIDSSLPPGTKNTQVLTLAQVSARNPLLDLVISVWRDKCLISVICDPQPHIKERMYDPLPMERGLRFVF